METRPYGRANARFDQLVRSLAGATTRREALRRVGGFLAGTFAAALGMEQVWGQSDPCKAACQRCSRKTQQQCLNACRACPSPSFLCGPCGRVTCCAGGKVCSSGRCVCPPGYADCNGACIDVRQDPANCGACGNVCPPAAPYCTDGVCSCPTGDVCGGVCTDLSSDPYNCGACGRACAAGSACVNGTCQGGCQPECIFPFICCGGVCVDPTSDRANCGGCGFQCSPSEVCIGGFCESY